MKLLSQDDRRSAIKPILLKLSELHLSPTSYESIKALYVSLQSYIQKGERIELYSFS
jgi:hypothetical protein